jgi:hypothetical protein
MVIKAYPHLTWCFLWFFYPLLSWSICFPAVKTESLSACLYSLHLENLRRYIFPGFQNWLKGLFAGKPCSWWVKKTRHNGFRRKIGGVRFGWKNWPYSINPLTGAKMEEIWVTKRYPKILKKKRLRWTTIDSSSCSFLIRDFPHLWHFYAILSSFWVPNDLQGIHLRENLNWKPWLLSLNIRVSCEFSNHPILGNTPLFRKWSFDTEISW